MFDTIKANAKKQINDKNKQRIFIVSASIATLIATGETTTTTTDSDLFTSGDVNGTPTDSADTITIGDDGGAVDLGAGDDTATGGDGVDTILGGAGADTISGGAGIDNLVVIGITVEGDYTEADLQDVAGTGVDLSALLTLADINNHSINDVEAGETIDGGDDGAILYTFGEVDFTDVTLNNITKIYLDSEVTLSDTSLQTLISEGLTDLLGDGTIKAQTGQLDLDGVNVPENVTIKDSDGNIILPIFTGEATASVEENSTAVGTFAVTDASAIGDVTYTLSGTDSDLFNINSSTGEVTFKSAPDYENANDDGANHIYDISVTATDEHQKSTSQDIEITVTNVNEAVSFSEASITINVAENQTAVTTVTATDIDGDDLTYTLTGDDADLFNIDETTGEITFKTPEDYENPTNSNQQYSVTVEATDGDVSTNLDVDITVTDVGATTDPVAPTLIVPSIQQYGTEFKVNTQTTSEQKDSAVAGLTDGGFVVTWASDDQDGNSFGVYGQRYDNVGNALNGEFLVNTITFSTQYTPQISGLNDGGFVVVWYSSFNDADDEPYEIRGQRYDADGVAQDGEFQINTGDYYLGRPFVTSLTGGGFVVTWYADIDSSSNDDYDVFGQIFDADGTPHGNEIAVNTFTAEDEYSSSITSLADGGFVIAWYGYEQDGSGTGSYFQRYDADGVEVGVQTQINTTTENYQDGVAVASLESGGFVAVWNDNGVTDGNQDIKANVYAADGAVLLAEFSVNQYSTNKQNIPEVVGLSDGGFLVTWASDGQDGDGYGLYGRRFAADGDPIDDEFLINSTTSGAQNYPSITALSNGGFVVTWHSSDGAGNGIYSQIFTIDSYKFEANTSYDLNILAALPDGQTGFTLGEITIANIADGMSFTDEDGDAVGTLDGTTLSLTEAQLTALKVKLDSSFNADVNLNIKVTSGNSEGVHTTTELSLAVEIVYAPEFSSDDVQTFNIDENSTAVGTLTATDAESQSLTYSLTGADANLFNIDNATGEITFNTAENYEDSTQADNQYDLIIIAADTEGLIDSKTVVVNVIDIDDAPEFISDDVHIVYMPDNRTEVVTLSATDEDNDDIVYTLATGGDNDQFTIDTATGKIDFDSLPNFNIPADSDADNIFDITVTATANGASDTREVEIHLTDYDAAILHVSNDVVKSGTEFQVNSYTENSQTYSAITSLSDGNFVITWQSRNQDGSSTGIFGQKYNPNGTVLGEEFQINTYTNNIQTTPLVTSLNDGGFVVMWSSYNQAGGSSRQDVYGQKFNGLGVADGAEFLVNATISLSQYEASVTALEDGGFMVVWTSLDNGRTIFGQKYDQNGDVTVAEFEINASSNNQKSQVAALKDGDYIVIWQEFGQDNGSTSGSTNGIYGQLYDENDDIITSHFLINSTTAGSQQFASATALEDGGFVVVWQSGNDQDGDGTGIFGQRYDSAGTADAIGEFQINTHTDDSQYLAKVAALDDGGFVVVWQSSEQDGDGFGIYGQRFDVDGNKQGSEILINTTTDNNQSSVDITATQNGGFIVTWSSNNQDGNGLGIYAQRYEYSDNYEYEYGVAQDIDVIAYVQSDQTNATLTSVTISGLTDGTVFSTGTDNGNNSWTFTETELDGLQITLGNAELDQVDLQLDAIFSNGNSGTATIQLEIGNITLGDIGVNPFLNLGISSLDQYYYGKAETDEINFFFTPIDNFDIAVVDNLLELTETSSGNQLYLNSIEKIGNISPGITTILVEDLYALGHIDSGVANQSEYDTWLAAEYNYN